MAGKTRELDLSFYRKVKIDKANLGNPGLHPGSGLENLGTTLQPVMIVSWHCAYNIVKFLRGHLKIPAW
jgi:hypothetical protein